MATRGPKPVPIEVKRRRGTLRPSRMPNRSTLGTVEPINATDVPPLASFAQVLSTASGWLAATDSILVAMLRESLEEREQLRELVTATGDVAHRRALRDLDRQIVTMLADLGFDPTARARLGLAEVKAATTLDRLRRER